MDAEKSDVIRDEIKSIQRSIIRLRAEHKSRAALVVAIKKTSAVQHFPDME